MLLRPPKLPLFPYTTLFRSELPGFGASPANTRSQSVQELANTVAQAAAQVVPEHYTLIGTSFGANVALWQTLQSPDRSEEHTSESSHVAISYAVFCLKKKKQ